MKKGYTRAKSLFTQVETLGSQDILETLHLIGLALKAVETRFDKAVAREPEEIRRIVRLMLDKAEE